MSETGVAHMHCAHLKTVCAVHVNLRECGILKNIRNSQNNPLHSSYVICSTEKHIYPKLYF